MVSKSSGKKDVALELEFYKWLIDKKKGTEKALEDTLRRLTGFKQRGKKK